MSFGFFDLLTRAMLCVAPDGAIVGREKVVVSMA
jgi:hypothetical protein